MGGHVKERWSYELITPFSQVSLLYLLQFALIKDKMQKSLTFDLFNTTVYSNTPISSCAGIIY